MSDSAVRANADVDRLAKAFAALSIETEKPLPARIAGAALAVAGVRRAAIYLRERGRWQLAFDSEPGAEPGDPPGGLRETAISHGGLLWVPLEAEGETHGCLALEGQDDENLAELAAGLGLVFGAVLAANRLSRLVKDAEFEIKARLLELESLYDLGLSLTGQLDISALADEVLYRSISLTDARKGTLLVFGERGAPPLSRSVGGDILPLEAARTWDLPAGEAAINNDAARVPTAGVQLSDCQKCLVVPIAMPGRRLGVLAVADKESRDGRVLDFTAADARLLALFANQAAAAIDTTRLHREAIERERLERELELAAAIQRQLLPRELPRLSGLELAGSTLPTRQVGGDYFDFFPLSRGRLGFVVADVSGKGIPAALLVSTVHAAIYLQIDASETIVELVSRIDKHLQRFSATHKFLTLFFGVLEPDSDLLRYVSAGHNPALLARRSGGIERLSATGVPLGLVPNGSWTEESVSFGRGDLICAYTDGFTEASNADDEEFGLERLEEKLTTGLSLPAREVSDRLFGAVADFAQGMPQYDDQTLLIVRRET
ncbi:MAG: PP2C family protein-serine/threonine phosphatase [Acidobacteriota bacterium]|nr:PP2C family protein-serine/threonine phosphatase [Acidobacteriota bacterium]MDQ5873205.1 PP2C family protein-serine/threonine phosphatase [Acidobacteriota bacterium]